MKRLEGAVLALEVLGYGLAASEGDLVGIQVEHLQSIVLQQVLHDYIQSIVSELVLPHRDLLEADVILKHLSKMNSDRLANSLVDWILDIQFFQGVVTRVEHREDTYYTIMINFIIAQVK